MEADNPDANIPGSSFDPRSIPVAQIDLSVRTANALKQAEIVFLGDLLAWTESDLMRLQNCGRKSVQEIIDVLAGHGLHLGAAADWTRPKESPPASQKTLEDFDEGIRPKLFLRIEDLDLSRRADNVLIAAGVEFVGELVQMTSVQLSSLHSCGRKSVDEIREKLEGQGFVLGTEISDWDRTFARAEHERQNSADVAEGLAKLKRPIVVEASCLEDELQGILRTFSGDRSAEIAAKHLGWSGQGRRTLESVGREYSITRERVRQIAATAIRKIRKNYVETPNLLRAIEAVGEVGPATSKELAKLLHNSGIARDDFGPSGLEAACEALDMKFGIEARMFGKTRIYGKPAALDALGSLHRLCRRLTSARGCANFDAMCDEVGIPSSDREGARSLISKIGRNVWLDDERRWLFAESVSRNRLINIVSKVLFVSPRIHLGELRRAAAKSRRLQTVPPAKVLARFLEANELASVSGDDVVSARTFEGAIEAGSSEATMVHVLKTYGPVLPWDKLHEYCIAEGMNPITAGIYMSISPVVSRVVRGVYALVGTKLEPGVVEEISLQLAKSRRPADFGWTSRSTLWCAIAINRSILTGGAAHLPPFVMNMVEGKEWRIRFGGRMFGTVINARNNFIWSLAKPLANIGAEPGDSCVLDFDLGALIVDLAVGGEDLVDAWESGDIDFLESDTAAIAGVEEEGETTADNPDENTESEWKS